jgi:hypothetical protein
MPGTGYEDWITYRTSNPTLALQRLSLHIQGLQTLVSSGRVASDSTSFDPGPILQMLNPGGFLFNELNRLEGVVNRIGIPRFQPTVRIDGGNYGRPDTGVGYGG